MTFLTESYYIRNKRRIPKENEFMEFEAEKEKNLRNYLNVQKMMTT